MKELVFSGECSVIGDMYFQSFDGRSYTFSATCQYVLAKSRNSGRFTVTIQNTPCGAVSVLFNQTSFVFKRTFSFSRREIKLVFFFGKISHFK